MASEPEPPASSAEPSKRRLGTGGVDDAPGEMDGCDRCGCPDEEKCCPGFWSDPGVPDLPVLRWVFNPDNKYLNDNKYCRMFGNFGFKLCDKERKAFMGTALAFTVAAIIITAIGAFGVSTDPNILRLSSWAITAVPNNGTYGQVMFVGLKQLVVRNCSESTGDPIISWDGCEDTIIELTEVQCDTGDEDFFGYNCEMVKACSDRAAGNYWGALITFATLILAMNGCLTRIKRVADTNLQKILGCAPDTNGVISLMSTLLVFKADCYDPFPETITVNGVELDVENYLGVGWVSFFFCLLAAIVRCTMHYCTPVPGGGQGCSCMDTLELITGMDLDGDGELGNEHGRAIVADLKEMANDIKGVTANVVTVGKDTVDAVKNARESNRKTSKVVPAADQQEDKAEKGEA
jgi:hypothetical protein